MAGLHRLLTLSVLQSESSELLMLKLLGHPLPVVVIDWPRVVRGRASSEAHRPARLFVMVALLIDSVDFAAHGIVELLLSLGLQLLARQLGALLVMMGCWLQVLLLLLECVMAVGRGRAVLASLRRRLLGLWRRDIRPRVSTQTRIRCGLSQDRALL